MATPPTRQGEGIHQHGPCLYFPSQRSGSSFLSTPTPLAFLFVTVVIRLYPSILAHVSLPSSAFLSSSSLTLHCPTFYLSPSACVREQHDWLMQQAFFKKVSPRKDGEYLMKWMSYSLFKSFKN